MRVVVAFTNVVVREKGWQREVDLKAAENNNHLLP